MPHPMICELWPNFWTKKEAVNLFQPHLLPSSIQLKTGTVFFLFKANPLQTCGDAFGRYLGTLRRLVGRATLQCWWTPWETRIAERTSFSVFGWFRMYRGKALHGRYHWLWSLCLIYGSAFFVFSELFWFEKLNRQRDILRNSTKFPNTSSFAFATAGPTSLRSWCC